jgi:alkaline phosphatase D
VACAPHLSFADIGGHGYATVRATSDASTTEFVCIPRPLDRSPGADAGPINYRVSHHAQLWRKGEKPVLAQRVMEGNADLYILTAGQGAKRQTRKRRWP